MGEFVVCVTNYQSPPESMWTPQNLQFTKANITGITIYCIAPVLKRWIKPHKNMFDKTFFVSAKHLLLDLNNIQPAYLKNAWTEVDIHYKGVSSK